MLRSRTASCIFNVVGCVLRFLQIQVSKGESWQKAELRKAERTMSVIIENKEDIAKLAAEILFSREEKK